MINTREEYNDGSSETTAAASIKIMECEEVETIMEYIKLQHNAEKLNNARSEHFVYEDHFNPTLCEYMENSASFQKLKTTCRKYEAELKKNIDAVLNEAFAIDFYTGSRSEACSRGASLVTRRANGVVIEDRTVEEMKEAAIVVYYLVKELSNITYYWGYVTRACQLNDQELALYTPGALITWLQFSSAKRGKNVADGGDFQHRNTQFKIYSLTGRRIQYFSNYDHEDEVLLLPHSTFLVFKHVIGSHGTQHTIYM
ncbi:unnamed protein product [Adineta ricciae]|nr:unnamed protein product [Adineta ricciae]